MDKIIKLTCESYFCACIYISIIFQKEIRNINLLFDYFFPEMWYWVFLWALFSSLFVHGAAGVLMFVMLQRHRQGRVISVIVVSIGFLGSVTGAMITSKSYMLKYSHGCFWRLLLAIVINVHILLLLIIFQILYWIAIHSLKETKITYKIVAIIFL